MTNINIKIADIKTRISDLTTPDIIGYRSSNPSYFEDIGNFSIYAKTNKYRPIINDLIALLKEQHDESEISEILSDIIPKYLDILESESSVAFSGWGHNHVIAACLMYYIKHSKDIDLEAFINASKGVLVSGVLGIAESMVEYIERVGWYADFKSCKCEFAYDVPLYNKMLNILLENNYFSDIIQEFPEYNHEIAWQEARFGLDWIDEDGENWCKNAVKKLLAQKKS